MDVAVTNIVMISLAVAAASITVSKTAITEGIRTWLWTKPRIKTVAYLADCPYCQAHWYAAILVAGIMPWEGFLQYLVYTGAAIALSAIAVGYILKLLIWDQREIDSLRKELEETQEVLGQMVSELE